MTSLSLHPTLRHVAHFSVPTWVYPQLCAMAERIRTEFHVWRAKRQLLFMDASLFKDAGVSSGNVDWLVRNGRDAHP
jgi:hypothetical protein